MLHQEPNRVTTRLLTRQKPHYMPIRIYLPEKLAHVCVCVWQEGWLSFFAKENLNV